jgi:hypothetical protein
VVIYGSYLHKFVFRKRSRSDEGEKELINISSDDDLLKNDDEDTSGQKSQNGASTSMKANTQTAVPAKVT